MGIYHSVSELTGYTPLLELERLSKLHGLHARLLAKLECCNPTGSVKDRAALGMVLAAERSGALSTGGVIIEPTSGNTGIGLASVAAARGYRVILTMPETMSLERRKLLAAYGAELVLTEGPKGMQGAVDRAVELAAQIPNSWIAGQFENPDNARAHYEHTGPELWADTEGNIDLFVAGIGSGGTITGCGRFLKEKNPAIHVVGVEPDASPLLSQGKAGPHGIQGLGANFVPKLLDTKIYDELITVTVEDAYETGRELARCEGVLAGVSSGAALWAAIQLAKRPEYKGKTIVAVLPDAGDRYLSTPMFESVK